MGLKEANKERKLLEKSMRCLENEEEQKKKKKKRRKRM
jgi:hypothetical protein